MAAPGSASLASAGFAGALDILAGAMGFVESSNIARIHESRGRILRLEAEADAVRYAEQATRFRAQQKLAFLKSGVELSGSPLDILDETMRVATENISAIRARGQAQGLAFDIQAAGARTQGRLALIKGITAGAVDLGQGFARQSEITGLGRPRSFPNAPAVGGEG